MCEPRRDRLLRAQLPSDCEGHSTVREGVLPSAILEPVTASDGQHVDCGVRAELE